MKTYIFANLDGTRKAMVRAKNLLVACRLVGCSQNDARAYGWHRGSGEEVAIAKSQPDGTVFYKPIDSKAGDVWKVAQSR